MKLIAFDLDGTLCNTLKDITDSMNRSLESFGYATFTDEQICAMIGKSITYMCQRAMPKGHENDWAPVRDRYFEDYSRHLCDATRPYEGMVELLDRLKEQGYLLAVVTNKPHAHAVSIIQTVFPHHGDHFAQVQGQANKFELKPHPQSFEFVLNSLGVAKEDTVYVGDSDVDVFFAKNTGVRFVGVAYGFRGEEHLRAAGAATVISTPLELLDVL